MGTILDISEDDVKQAEAFEAMDPGVYLFKVDNVYIKRNKANTGDNWVVSLVGAEEKSEGKRILKHFAMKSKEGKSLLGFMKSFILACGGTFAPGAQIDMEGCKEKVIRVKVINRLDEANDTVRNEAADFYPAD